MIRRVDSSTVKRTSKFVMNKTAKFKPNKAKMGLPEKLSQETEALAKKNGENQGVRKGWGNSDCTYIDPCAPLFP